MRPLFALLAVLVLLPFASAAPSEAHPDCEADQPWVGYRSSEPIRGAYAAQGSPGGLALCEGEHWDGQDDLRAEDASCAGSFSLDPAALHAGFCMANDPNRHDANDLLSPLGARVSTDDGAVYASARVATVARGSMYADEGTVAVYARDDTPGNIIATIVSCCSVTPRPPGDMDCDQATYQEGMMSGDRRCWRDNTALTLEHGLLP